MNDVNEPILDLPGARFSQATERPAVVICHDHGSFPEWGFLPYLAALLAARGFVAIRFQGTEPADLLAVLEAIETLVPGRVDRRRLGLFGHGHGGGNAILAAAQPPWSGRVRALVTWSATADVDVSGLAAPWLIVHGGEDEAIPVEESRRLAEGAGGPRELLVIPGASHSFGSRHPFPGPTPQLIQALNATQRWFRAHL